MNLFASLQNKITLHWYCMIQAGGWVEERKEGKEGTPLVFSAKEL
jgi:hypothetical protein